MPSPAQPLELRQSRGFSQQVNFTVEFIRRHRRMLVRSVLSVAGPSIVLSWLLLCFGWYLRWDLLAAGSFESSRVMTIVMGLGQFVLLSIILIFDICAVHAFVVLHLRHGGEGFGTREVWREARAWLLKVARILLVIGGMMFFITLFCLILIELVGGTAGIVAGVAAAAGALYLLVLLSPLMTVRLYEDLYTSEGVKRCFQLVRRNWWLTFWVMGLFQILVAMPSALLEVASYLITWLGEFDPYAAGSGSFVSGLLVLMGSSSIALAGLTQSVVVLAGALHYFNLVEKKEGIRISERIASIGTGEEHGASDTALP